MSICPDSDDAETELDHFSIPFTFLRKPEKECKIILKDLFSFDITRIVTEVEFKHFKTFPGFLGQLFKKFCIKFKLESIS